MRDLDPEYMAHDDFVRPARARTELWRVGTMMMCFEAAFWFAPVVIIAMLPSQAMIDGYIAGITASATLAQLASFGITALIFIAALRRIHNRGFWTLIGPAVPAVSDMIRVCWAVGLVLLAIELLPPWHDMAEIEEVRSPLRWGLILPFAIGALIIQVGTEELIYRGYLQQQFACLSDRKWVWMGIPSALFGAAHLLNGFGPADSVMWAIWAGCLGLACADLTARTGTIGAAIGLHLANNIFAIAIYGMQDWPNSGLALLLYPYDDPTQYDYSLSLLFTPWLLFPLAVQLATVWVMWLAARLAIRR